MTNPKKRRTTPHVCQHCGQEFAARVDDIKQGKAKFCSVLCVRRGKPVHTQKSRIARVCKWKLKMKAAAFEHYGGPKCSCCGESQMIMLTIDHINMDGNAHRKEIGKTARDIYIWLRRNNYPAGFRVLCFNCNFAAFWNGGVCPHTESNAQAE